MQPVRSAPARASHPVQRSAQRECNQPARMQPARAQHIAAQTIRGPTYLIFVCDAMCFSTPETASRESHPSLLLSGGRRRPPSTLAQHRVEQPHVVLQGCERGAFRPPQQILGTPPRLFSIFVFSFKLFFKGRGCRELSGRRGRILDGWSSEQMEENAGDDVCPQSCQQQMH